jgi:hypothetical protein
MAEKSEPRERIFSTSPQHIVVFEERPYDEPVIEPVVDPSTGKTSGIRQLVGRNKGVSLHCRSEQAHIEGKYAHPIDGSEPLPYGPGKAGHWARSAHGER